MDPHSVVTGSIISIIQLSATLARFCSQVQDASNEQKRVLVETRNLNKVFHDLQSRIDIVEPDAPWTQAVQQLGTTGGALDQLKHTLELLASRIVPRTDSGRLRSALKWPWTKDEVEKAISQAHRLHGLIQYALTSDLHILTQEIHDDLSKWSSRRDESLAQSSEDVQQLRDRADEAEMYSIKQWLGVPDPSSNYNTALSRKHPQTGNWLLADPRYQAWKSTESSFMWLHGIPGCGKTFLSVTILQDLLGMTNSFDDPRHVGYVAYFYCDFNNVQKQSATKLLRSLVFQLASKVPGYANDLKRVYETCQSGHSQPGDDLIRELFDEYISGMNQPLFLMIDALDECLKRDSLLSYLQQVVEKRYPLLHLIITSRRERDIDEALGSLPDFAIDIQASMIDQDIHSYVRGQLARNSKLAKLRSMHGEIENVLMEKAQGMFRWVECQLETLKRCINPNAVRKTLRSLPQNLDETYERIFEEIKSNGELDQAIWILQWLCFTQFNRGLSAIAELCVIFNGENGGYDDGRRLFDPSDIIRICSGFITVSQRYEVGYLEADAADFEEALEEGYLDFWDPTPYDDQGLVRLAHYSVKEYLLSSRCSYQSRFNGENAHLAIAEGCLHYVLHLCQLDHPTDDVLTGPPIARYAISRWYKHLKLGQSVNPSIALSLASNIFSRDSTALRPWLRMYELVVPWNTMTHGGLQDAIAEPLYYMAATGLYPLVPSELSGILAANYHQVATIHGTALQAALLNGHLEIVRLLLNHGFDVNINGGKYGMALHVASFKGSIDGVRLILGRSADVNAIGGEYGTALQAAAACYPFHDDCDNVLRILLNHHADVNVVSGIYGTALQAASLNRRTGAVRLLLQHGADVDIVAGKYGTALQAAAFSGQINLIQLLLDYKPDTKVVSGKYGTALQAASLRGVIAVVSMLLDYGFEINMVGGTFGTALQAASVHGQIETVRLLLEHKADANMVGGEYGTALQAASFRGHIDIVRLLLDLQTDVNLACGKYGTALGAALYKGNSDVVQLLLEHGADEEIAEQALARVLKRASR